MASTTPTREPHNAIGIDFSATTGHIDQILDDAKEVWHAVLRPLRAAVRRFPFDGAGLRDRARLLEDIRECFLIQAALGP